MTAGLQLAGQRFGRLVAVEVSGRSGRRRLWLCRCDCGNEIQARASSLTEGNTRSCGCLVRDTMAEIGTRHGTHRLSRTLEYHSWRAMKSRCYSPINNRYEQYGARGIRICDRWLESFEAFLADMGPRPSPQHSIDRIDNDGNYEPGNCRWGTRVEQRNNRTDTRERATA